MVFLIYSDDMKYVICLRSSAELHDFRTAHHLMDDSRVVLSEKEVLTSTAVTGTLEERASQLDGVVSSLQEVKFSFNS